MTQEIQKAAANGVQNAERVSGSLKDYLSSGDVVKRLAEVCGAVMKPQDLVRLTLMAASRQPEIMRCTKTSVLRALMDAAALGIKPGGLMGRGYLVPRARNWKDDNGRWHKELELHFDPGWRGLIDIARRSGQIRRIEAHVVFESDEFEVQRNPFTTIRHVPNEGKDPGAIRAAYAVAQFADGSEQIEIVWRRDIDQIRALGAAKGPWDTWAPEMARKTAVRRLCKYLPYDPILERALEAATDAEAEEAIGRDVLPTVEVDRPPQAKRLASKIASRKVAAPEEGTVPAAAAPLVDPMTGEVIEEEVEQDDPEPAEREPGID